MSIRTVSREVRTALQDKVVTAQEAKSIVAEAEKGRVTTGESRQLADVWDAANRWTTDGPVGHLSPPRVQMDNEARGVFNAYFAAHGVPSGDSFDGVKAQIERSLGTVDRGQPLACAPNLKNLHPVFLRDKRPVDGERLDAFLDTEKKEFYLQSTGAGMAGPDTIGPWFYGPFPLDTSPLGAADLKKMLEGARARELGQHAFGPLSRSAAIVVDGVSARDDGLFDVDIDVKHFLRDGVLDSARVVVDGQGALQPGAVPSVKDETQKALADTFKAHADSLTFREHALPLGRRVHSVKLDDEITALIPVGALAPGAKALDPNKATEVYFEKLDDNGRRVQSPPVKLTAG